MPMAFGTGHDLRFALRRLRNSPAFAVVAIATVALAIGANTAMFSFVNGVLLRPLPYPDSDRIVRVLERLPAGGLNGASTLNYLDWSTQNAVFDAMAAGLGAQREHDGVDTGGVLIIPQGRAPDAEMTEYLYPLLMVWRREESDSGGPGRRRGGVSDAVAYSRI